MAKVGETITLQGGIKTGYAPGVEQWNVGKGQQVKILNTRTQNGQLYYDIQHIGGGTGWTTASGLDAAIQASSPTPAQINSKTQANKITSPVKPATVDDRELGVLASMGNSVNKAAQSLSDAITKQQTDVNKDLQAEQKKQDQAMGEVKKLTTPFRAEQEQAGRAKYGTDQVLEDQKALLGELDQLLTEGNELINQQSKVTGLAAIRNPRIQKTMDDVLARAGVIEAVVNLQNTYLANAYNAIDRTIGAMAADRQDQIAYYSSVIDLADRKIIELTSEKRALAHEKIGLLEKNLDQGIESANKIKELMENPATAMMMAKAGVTLNDSVSQINNKMAKYQVANEIREKTNEFLAAGAQPVVNPAGVPAHLLASYTDPNGTTHYFKYSEKPKEVTPDPLLYFQNWLDTKIGSIDDIGVDTGQTTNEPQPPSFSGGYIGDIYVDPSTGTIWQFAGNYWQKKEF